LGFYITHPQTYKMNAFLMFFHPAHTFGACSISGSDKAEAPNANDDKIAILMWTILKLSKIKLLIFY
jgi:hypothetical protein